MYTEDQVRKVLTSAGVQIVNNVSSDFIVFCPFHNNNRTPAGEINHETGLFYCFSCKQVARLEDFLTTSSGIKYFQALRLIDKYKHDDSIVDIVGSILDEDDTLPEFPAEDVERLHKNALRTQRAVDYFKKRGLEYDSVIKHKFGYSEKQDMIVMPYLSPTGDKYLGVEGRSIEGKRFKAGGPKSHTLFNLNNRIWSDSIMLTESIIDCVRIEQNGGEAVSSMGSSRGKVQVSLLNRYFNKVYIVADVDDATNDFAGQVGAQKLADRLGQRGIIVLPPKGFKDVGEMPDELIKKLVADRDNLLGDI